MERKNETNRTNKDQVYLKDTKKKKVPLEKTLGDQRQIQRNGKIKEERAEGIKKFF